MFGINFREFSDNVQRFFGQNSDMFRTFLTFSKDVPGVFRDHRGPSKGTPGPFPGTFSKHFFDILGMCSGTLLTDFGQLFFFEGEGGEGEGENREDSYSNSRSTALWRLLLVRRQVVGEALLLG